MECGAPLVAKQVRAAHEHSIECLLKRRYLKAIKAKTKFPTAERRSAPLATPNSKIRVRTLLTLNAIAASASAIWGVVAIMRPEALSGSNDPTNDDRFYVRMYAARAIPFGVAACSLPLLYRGNEAVVWVLVTAALMQGADVAIAIEKKQLGMAVGAAIGATVHFACGFAYTRS